MANLDIIVPFYNDFSGIQKLLKSLIQFSKFTNIIIVDDSSSEEQYAGVLKLSEEYSYIKVIKNNSGLKGAGSCRNIGLLESNAPWIIFADSDDHFLKGAAEIIQHYTGQDYDMVYFPPISTDEKGNLGHRHDTYLSYFKSDIDSLNYNNLRYKLPVVWSRLFNSTFIKSNKITFEETIVSNDRMFSLISGVKASSIKIEKNSVYSWNFNSSSLTTKMSKERFWINLKVFERANTYLKSNVDNFEFKTYSESGCKYIAMSLIRYKYGILFTFKILLYFINKRITIINIADLKRLKTFFINNKYYSE